VYYMKIADRKRASGQIFQRLFPSFSSCINDINSRSIILFYSTSIYQKRDHYLFYFNFKRLNYIMTSSKRTIFLSDLIYFIAELWIIKLSSLKN
jgi:hypothetical protein